MNAFLASILPSFQLLQFDELSQIQWHVAHYESSSCFLLRLSFRIQKYLSSAQKYWHRNATNLLPCFHHKYQGNAPICALLSNSYTLLATNECLVQKRFPTKEHPHDSNRQACQKRPHREYFFQHLLPCEYALIQYICQIHPPIECEWNHLYKLAFYPA